MEDFKHLLEIAVQAAEQASKEILEVYYSDDFQTELKDDRSPLTQADKRAHRVIVEGLHSTGLPVLSEEGRDIGFEERKNWDLFWMVDPLDGTKEFVKRNDEFTVNIALIKDGVPVLGVVSVPVTKETYYGGRGLGVFKQSSGEVIPLEKGEATKMDQEGIRVVASRSHLNEETQQFMAQLNSPQIISAGSSLKFMLLAEGKADVYPRYAPTMEWDTAAAHAILLELGGQVKQVGKELELRYNKENLLNPSFVATLNF